MLGSGKSPKSLAYWARFAAFKPTATITDDKSNFFIEISFILNFVSLLAIDLPPKANRAGYSKNVKYL